jgi:hypothetical protein
MLIDWASVNWGYVALLSGFTFIAALIANFITFRHRMAGAILTALLFAAYASGEDRRLLPRR